MVPSGMTNPSPSRRRSTPFPCAAVERRDSLVSNVVFVSVHVDDPPDIFFVQLTRVPGIGEEIVRGGDIYRAIRVAHHPVDDNGRTRFGSHATVVAALVPDDPPRRQRRRRTGWPVDRVAARAG